MADTTIRISNEARDRLKAVAAERGVSARALAESVFMELTTRTERGQRAEQGLAYVRAHLCHDLSPHDIQEAATWYADISAGRVGEVH
ncbi:hypothetical protein N4G70_34610 [Streptomyces sp. ASQP_92]|uniref:hypothetical protein n=1 Tax=Streptomyces sp. ASQP_92 TaxID=2979116 RepID=UPI0021BFC5E8|nr:hypothetical protein [Streptomyces sp. ASQP_92]MCT9093953.1 hypothetical protein [Streptomyces sp. ASQP_92]